MPATVYIHGCYSTHDLEGNALTHLKGLLFEVLKPGACEWELAGRVAWPEMVLAYSAEKDGAYAFRHRTEIFTVTQGVNDGRCVAASEPSDPVTVIVDQSPPAKPPRGSVIVPCAH